MDPKTQHMQQAREMVARHDALAEPSAAPVEAASEAPACEECGARHWRGQNTLCQNPSPEAPVEPVAPKALPQMPEERWYSVDREGVAMLCSDEDDARANAEEAAALYPHRAPYRAMRLGDVAAAYAAGMDRAVEDAERLDYIEKNARCDPKMSGQHVWWPTSFNHRLTGPTLRDAIDDAIRAAKGK